MRMKTHSHNICISYFKWLSISHQSLSEEDEEDVDDGNVYRKHPTSTRKFTHTFNSFSWKSHHLSILYTMIEILNVFEIMMLHSLFMYA